MRTQPLKAIAGKEFRDHIRSRRFHILFGILLVIALIGLIGGVNQYQESLERYQEMQTVAANADEPPTTPPPLKPTILFGLAGVYIITALVGVFLGVAMGFDSVTKEKESRSLKLLLSHPIYRDEVITGKALGGAAAIALAMAIVLVISFAVLLIFGIVPNVEETIRVLIFGGLSFLMIFSFFILALFFSTIAPNSGSALVSSLLLIIILYAVVPTISSGGPVTVLLIGEPPEAPEYPSVLMEDPEDPSKFREVRLIQIEPGEEIEAYEEASNAYSWRRGLVDGIATLVSPYANYQEIIFSVDKPNYLIPPELIRNVIAFFAFPMIFFGLAWVRFAREDIR